MEGINLSSSVPEGNQRKSRFFNGSTFIVFIFIVLCSAWGGMYLYGQSLVKILQQKQDTFTTKSQEIKNDKANRTAELDARVKLAQKQLKDTVNTDELLTQLEASVIPNIRLTKYEFNAEKKVITIAGETDDFQYIPQQIEGFKAKGVAKDVAVESLEKKEGVVSFLFKINL